MKWAIREAVDVFFKAKSTFKLGARTFRIGEPVLIFDTVKTSTLEVAAQISYVSGGRGNARILSYEGDKTLTFNFEEALLSAEGMAILAGADLIPARNPHLTNASPDARSIVSHVTEKYSIETPDVTDSATTNYLGKKGAKESIWVFKKPYVGQNSSIYVMLLDDAGEISGAPIEVGLNADGAATEDKAYVATFKVGDKASPFDKDGEPITMSAFSWDADDKVAYYVKDTAGTITVAAGDGLEGQPCAFKEGNKFVYKINVPSIMYQDIVLVDYYTEYRHNAVQVSILPDKFAPFMYVEGSSLVRRASDGTDLPVEFVIPKLKVTTQISFALQSTGDPSTFNFQGDAYPDFSKFDLTRKVLADIQILDADDNYDGTTDIAGDPTGYRRYVYNEDSGGDYIWKDPTIKQHNNIDISDTADSTGAYDITKSGPVTSAP